MTEIQRIVAYFKNGERLEIDAEAAHVRFTKEISGQKDYLAGIMIDPSHQQTKADFFINMNNINFITLSPPAKRKEGSNDR